MDDIYYQLKPKVMDLKDKTIGIHGINGSFTDEALGKIMHNLNIAKSHYSVKELIHADRVIKNVISKKVDRGIFAIANSGSGGYVESLKAMAAHELKLIGVLQMPLKMCILSQPNIKCVEEITEFQGHPVAIAQCHKTLAQKWPNIPVSPGTDKLDTALSATYLADGKLSPTTGVFASERAADIFGLKVLQYGVNHDPNNATFFCIVKKA